MKELSKEIKIYKVGDVEFTDKDKATFYEKELKDEEEFENKIKEFKIAEYNEDSDFKFLVESIFSNEILIGEFTCKTYAEYLKAQPVVEKIILKKHWYYDCCNYYNNLMKGYLDKGTEQKFFILAKENFDKDEDLYYTFNIYSINEIKKMFEYEKKLFIKNYEERNKIFNDLEKILF